MIQHTTKINGQFMQYVILLTSILILLFNIKQ